MPTQSLTTDWRGPLCPQDPLADGLDGGEKVMMLEVVAADSLSRVCRGGEHCCRPDQPCGEGAGDCNTDQASLTSSTTSVSDCNKMSGS